MNEHNIEIGIVGPDRKFKILTPAEVQTQAVSIDRQAVVCPLSFESIHHVKAYGF